MARTQKEGDNRSNRGENVWILEVYAVEVEPEDLTFYILGEF